MKYLRRKQQKKIIKKFTFSEDWICCVRTWYFTVWTNLAIVGWGIFNFMQQLTFELKGFSKNEQSTKKSQSYKQCQVSLWGPQLTGGSFLCWISFCCPLCMTYCPLCQPCIITERLFFYCSYHPCLLCLLWFFLQTEKKT